MTASDDTQDKIRRYFRGRSLKLLAGASEAVCDHPVIIGDQREEEFRSYLRELLPRRFQVDKGMVYGTSQRSRQADVVIWEADHYPRIPQGDSSLLFAESVRAIVEVKSSWSTGNRDDIWEKCAATHELTVGFQEPLEDRVWQLEADFEEFIASLSGRTTFRGRRPSDGRNRIAFAALVYSGGAGLCPETMGTGLKFRRSSELPDVLAFLEAGKVLHKRYDSMEAFGGHLGGRLDYYDAGADALLVFTALILDLLINRSAHLVDPFYLKRYCDSVLSEIPTKSFEFGPADEDSDAAVFMARP